MLLGGCMQAARRQGTRGPSPGRSEVHDLTETLIYTTGVAVLTTLTMMGLIATLVLLFALGAAAKPNFVIIFVDDMGVNQIQVPAPAGFAGYSGDNGTVQTPHLSKFAAEGMVFANWYSSFHVCSPSRASMMTGRLSVRSGIGIPNSRYAPDAPGYSGSNLVFTAEALGGLPLNETTTAEALRSAGYATLACGKWHLGQRKEYLPTARGFDEYLGIPFSQDMGESFWLDGPDAHAPFQPTPLPLLDGDQIVEQPVDLSTLTTRYVQKVLEWIGEKAASKQPFYVYLALNHIHAPNSCSAEFCGSSERGPIGDAIQEVDAAVGRLMDGIKASGVDNSTFVLFTSDNGAPLSGDSMGNLPLRGGKGQTWEGGFREPALARWPGRIAPGSAAKAIASTLDVHPTLLSLADVRLPSDRVFDGLDLSPILFGSPRASGHRCFYFYNAAAAVAAESELWAVRCGDFKAYFETNGPGPGWKGGKQDPPLLFDLAVDPGESTPVGPSTATYHEAMDEIAAARSSHLATIDRNVPNQNARGSDASVALCSAPGALPYNCTITPSNWAPESICGSTACLASNPAFRKRCGAITQIYDVLEYGAHGDGVADDTAAVRTAAAAVAAAGGGTLLFREGHRFLTGAFNLSSNVVLQIDGTIVGSSDGNQWPLLDAGRVWPQYGHASDCDPGTEACAMMHQALVFAWNASNLTIRGQGTIDGNATSESWWRCAHDLSLPPCLGYARPHLMLLSNCTDVTVLDITVRNSPDWTLHFSSVSELLVDGVKVVNPGDGAPNTDGIDLDCVQNAVVRNCYFDVGDDALCVKSGIDYNGRAYGRPSRNILFSNVTIGRGHGISVGSETSGGVTNVTFEDIFMNGTERGPRIKSQRGRGGVVDGITFRRVRARDISNALISLSLEYHAGLPATNASATPVLRNVILEDVVFSHSTRTVELLGLAESPIEGVVLRNVTFGAEATFSSCKHVVNGVCIGVDACPPCFRTM